MSFTFPFYTLIFRNSSFNCVDSQTLSDTNTTVSNQPQKPPMYKVLMLNDDFTPMNFVVYILETIFQKNNETAVKTMLEVHNNGIGNCGVFTYEVAETKQEQVIQLAKKHQYPLQCVLEKE